MKLDRSDCICARCEFASYVCDDDVMLCRVRGIVPADWHCRKFSYDPVKRVPPGRVKVTEHEFVDIDADD